MDPQRTNSSQENGQEERKRGIPQAPMFGRRFGSRLVMRAGMAAGRSLLMFFLTPQGTVVIAIGLLLFFTLFIIFSGIPGGGIPSGPEPSPTGTPAPTPSSSTPTLSPVQPCPSGTNEKTITANQASSMSYNVSDSKDCRIWSVIGTLHPNIPVNHGIIGYCRSSTFAFSTDYAVFNFEGLSISKGTEIKSATLYSPTSGGCETASITGRAETLSPFSDSGAYKKKSPTEPSFPYTGGSFGKNKMTKSASFYGCPLPGIKFFCGGCYEQVLECANSGSPQGTGDVTNIIGGIVATQDINSVAFKLRPDYSDSICGSTSYTNFTASFQVTAAGTTLNIIYCAPNSP